MEDYQNYEQKLNMETKPQYEEPVSVKEWIITMLLLMIPIVNLVLMFVWAFSSEEKKSKSNYFKASLIIAAVLLALYFLVFIVIIGAAIVVGTQL